MGLVTGGRLADMLGRRLIFFIGAAIFAGFSILGAIAPSAIVLIIARVGMGVGGALMLAGDPRDDLRRAAAGERPASPAG